MVDFIIVIAYFIIIFSIAISGRVNSKGSVEEYFLSNRNLKWYSIALSTIATNVQGYQFLGMMGSAYLYGLAQAICENPYAIYAKCTKLFKESLFLL